MTKASRNDSGKGRIVSGLWVWLYKRKICAKHINIFHRYFYRPNTKIGDSAWLCDAVVIDISCCFGNKKITAEDIEKYFGYCEQKYGITNSMGGAK